MRCDFIIGLGCEAKAKAAAPRRKGKPGAIGKVFGTIFSQPRLRKVDSRACKPNSVCRKAAPLWAETQRRRPRTAGRPFLWAAHYCAALATYPKVLRTEQARGPPSQPALSISCENMQRRRDSLPIWSCSVWGLPCPSHYWSGGALLPHLFTLTLAGRYVFCGTFRQLALKPASRTLSGTLLSGVRTFLPSRPERRIERPSGPAAYVIIICAPLQKQLTFLTADR